MATTIEIPTLYTERLNLRAPVLSDLDAVAEYRASVRTRYVGGVMSRSQSFDSLCGLVGHWQLRGYGRWIIADGKTDAPLGVVGPFFPENWPEPEIAWTVFAAAEGRGIAFEAALAARSYAYETLGWTTAISLITSGNDRSIALAKRLGCHFDKVLDHSDYGAMEVWRHPPSVPADGPAGISPTNR